MISELYLRKQLSQTSNNLGIELFCDAFNLILSCFVSFQQIQK
jgi:hypothetical protein